MKRHEFSHVPSLLPPDHFLGADTMSNRKSRQRFYPLSRNEHDAKINASESRIDSKLNKIHSDIDSKLTEIKADIKSLTTTVDATQTLLIEYKSEKLSPHWPLWAIFAAVCLGFLGIIFK